MENKICTRCGKEFDKFRISIMLATNIERKAATGDWENLPNLGVETLEVLCEDCFDLYSKTITDAMNRSKEDVKH